MTAKMTLRGVAIAVLATGLGSGFAYAQADLAALEAAAKAEGELTIYSSNQDAEMEAKLAAFEAKYPEIDAEYIRLPSTQVFARFIAEHEAGTTQADLLTTASTVIYQEKPELFMPLGADNVPELSVSASLIPPENSNYAVYQTDVQIVTYNSNMVSDADIAEHLQSWEDLADPRWKGQMALVDPRGSTNQQSFFLGLQEIYGDEWFNRFMANDPEIVGTASSASQQVAAGAYQLLVPSVPVHSKALRGQGAPIGLTLPTGFVHAPAQGTAVPVGSAHPNAALLFVNWLLSAEGQTLQCTLGGIPTMPVDAPECVKTLPAKYQVGRDVIPTAKTDAVYALMGLAP